MKKSMCVAAVAALFCASSVMASTMKVRVVESTTQSTSYNLASSPATVSIEIQAVLDDTDAAGSALSDGLAIIGLNLKPSVSGTVLPAVPDLCDTSAFLVVAPAGMANFDRKDTAAPGFTNYGLTNPSGSPNISGYSGTCDGNNGLLQIGGGQNTIGNTVGGAPYPIGAVDNDKGNNGWEVIATGTVDVSLVDDQHLILTPDTVFANTLDNYAGGSPYAVSEVLSGGITVEALDISAGVECLAADINCDGNVNVADIGKVASGANFGQNPPACDRANVNGDTAVNTLDIGIVASGANFGQSTGPCVCNTNTPVECGVAP